MHERALRAFIRCSTLFRKDSERYFAGFGISGAQWGALRTLHRAEGERISGLRLRELGDRMLVRPPSMTGVIDRLERSGYVSKQSSPSDRRAKQVSLTRQGRDLVRHVLRQNPDRIRSILGDLSASDARTLLRLIEHMAERLESRAATPHTEQAHRA